MNGIRRLIAVIYAIIIFASIVFGAFVPQIFKDILLVSGFFIIFFLDTGNQNKPNPDCKVCESDKLTISEFEQVQEPYMVTSSTGIVLGFNEPLKELYKNVQKDKPIENFINFNLLKDNFLKINDEDFYILSWSNRNMVHYLLVKSNSILNLDYKKKPEDVCVAVGTIFIDNYEEALDTIEEARHSILTALIDRKLTNIILGAGGVIKKFEKDRYIFVISEAALEKFKSCKFEVFDEIKEINMGNKMPVTLSIGIGIHGESLSGNMEFSRNALDLALGRGGDQVLVRDSEKFNFYGGKTKNQERNSNVRARVKAYALIELIKESGEIFIMGHENPDMDCLGAAVGVYRMADSFGKKPFIILDSVSVNIKRLYERLIEGDSLHKTRFLKSELALEKMNKHSLLVVVDTHRPSYCQCKEALTRTDKIVVIDHHRKSTEYIENTVLVYHEPYASSASELIAEMLQYTGAPTELRPVEADCLLAGITVDTKNFTIKTGAKTFEAAAYLRRNGADTVRVRIALQNDMDSYVAKALAVSDAEIFLDSIAISKCSDSAITPALTAAQAADELLNIEGISASFVLARVGQKTLISARSLGDLNVQRIMEKLGGGGHQTVAGAQVPITDTDEVLEMLKNSITSYLKEESA